MITINYESMNVNTQISNATSQMYKKMQISFMNYQPINLNT